MNDNPHKPVDMVLVCIDCQREFTFTIGEQTYYASRSLTIPPRRCKPCRVERRARLVPDPNSWEGRR